MGNLEAKRDPDYAPEYVKGACAKAAEGTPPVITFSASHTPSASLLLKPLNMLAWARINMLLLMISP
jgi:GDP-D-mannose dehydratase